MTLITIKDITADESRIYDEDGDLLGEVIRQPDILRPARHYFVIYLDEDPRGPHRVLDRSRVRDEAQARYDTHPYY